MVPALPRVLLVWLAVNIVTFFWVGRDKRAAQAGRRRTPEDGLVLLSLLGGWLGGRFAFGFFDHKLRSKAFRRWFALAGILSLVGYALAALLAWWAGAADA